MVPLFQWSRLEARGLGYIPPAVRIEGGVCVPHRAYERGTVVEGKRCGSWPCWKSGSEVRGTILASKLASEIVLDV